MAQMTFLDTSPKPTKKYIGSLFRSEGLVCRSDQIEICQTGWIDAQNDTDKVRREQVLRMQNSIGIQRWNGYRVDVYCLGYVTFVYGYTDAMQERR